VDVGIARFATLSDGRILDNPRPLERSLERIRTLQRALFGKRFLSGNWLKAKTKLSKQHKHVGDFRRGVFFKLGVTLVQGYYVLVLEDLDVWCLIQRAKPKRGG
jgi:putative transposase